MMGWTMTLVHNRHKRPAMPDTGHAVIDCHPARLRARASDRVTVLAVSGEIDACNADPVGEYIQGFIAPGRDLILDLANLEFLGVAGLNRLFAVSVECATARAGWALVTSHPVRRLLRVADPERTLPAVGSMHEALQRL
jgi:anti-anti-sigma factor